MIGPESISVPSRSKRTTGEAHAPIVASRRAPPPPRSVVDVLEVEPPGRRGRPAVGTRSAFEERAIRRARLEHRADERPHHVTQERVGGDREVEVVVAAFPGGRPTSRRKTRAGSRPA